MGIFKDVYESTYGGDDSTSPVTCFWSGKRLECISDCALAVIRNVQLRTRDDYVIISREFASILDNATMKIHGRIRPRMSLEEYSKMILLGYLDDS